MAQPQILVPGSTVDNGGFTAFGAATHHECVDEGYPADDIGGGVSLTEVRSPTSPANATIKFGALKDAYTGATAFDPGTDESVILNARVYYSAVATVDHTIEVRKADGTLIAGRTVQTTNTTHIWVPLHLSAAEVANFDWPNMQLWYTANHISGTGGSARLVSNYLGCPGDALTLTTPSAEWSDAISWWTAASVDVADGADVAAWQDQIGGRHLHTNLLRSLVVRPDFTASDPDFRGLPALSFDTDQSTFYTDIGAPFGSLAQGHVYVGHYVDRIGALGPFAILDWPAQGTDAVPSGQTWPIFLHDNAVGQRFGLNEQGGAHIFGGTVVEDAETVFGGQWGAPTDNDEIFQDGVSVAGPTDLGSLTSVGLSIGSRTQDVTKAGRFGLHCLTLWDHVLSDTEEQNVADALFAETTQITGRSIHYDFANKRLIIRAGV